MQVSGKSDKVVEILNGRIERNQSKDEKHTF